MSLAFGATAQSGAATDFQTVFSFNHTIGGGANRMVLVGIAGRQGGTGAAVPTPTYNGVAMTLVKAQGFATASGFCAGLWLIKEANLPAAGTYAIACTLSDTDSTSYGLVAVDLTGVDQVNLVNNAQGGNGADATPTLTISSAAGNFVVSVNVCSGDPASNFFTCDGTETIRNIVPNGDSHNRCIMQTKVGAASVVMAPTQTPSTWFEVGGSIVAGTTPPPASSAVVDLGNRLGNERFTSENRFGRR